MDIFFGLIAAGQRKAVIIVKNGITNPHLQINAKFRKKYAFGH